MDDTALALITGAADGIGWATAGLSAARGYRVAIADLDGKKAAAHAAELGRGATSPANRMSQSR